MNGTVQTVEGYGVRVRPPWPGLVFVLLALTCIAVGLVWEAKTHMTHPRDEFPTGERWIQHMCQDLLPYWYGPNGAGLGSPCGFFPTFRNRVGRPFEKGDWLKGPGDFTDESWETNPDFDWLTKRAGRTYVRSISRQTYGFLVAYHLTGDPRFLALGKTGIDFLFNGDPDGKPRINAPLGPDEKGFVVYFEDGKAVREPMTLLDLADCLMGPAFYYYLTHDSDCREKILMVQKIISKRNSPGLGESPFQWVEKDCCDLGGCESGKCKGKERVFSFKKNTKALEAPLEQLLAYELLLYRLTLKDSGEPGVGEFATPDFRCDAEKCIKAIGEEYYDSDVNRFLTRKKGPREGGGRELKEGNLVDWDFGHSAQAFASLILMNEVKGEHREANRWRERAKKMLRDAFKKPRWTPRDQSADQNASKNYNPVNDNVNDSWWVYCSLDQLAAILSIEKDPEVKSMLSATSKWWLEDMVDRPYGEVFYGFGDERHSLPKANLWKGGFQSAEHALVMYMVAQHLHQRPIRLYFAFNKDLKDKKDIYPYWFGCDNYEESPNTPWKSEDRKILIGRNKCEEKCQGRAVTCECRGLSKLKDGIEGQAYEFKGLAYPRALKAPGCDRETQPPAGIPVGADKKTDSQ